MNKTEQKEELNKIINEANNKIKALEEETSPLIEEELPTKGQIIEDIKHAIKEFNINPLDLLKEDKSHLLANNSGFLNNLGVIIKSAAEAKAMSKFSNIYNFLIYLMIGVGLCLGALVYILYILNESGVQVIPI